MKGLSVPEPLEHSVPDGQSSLGHLSLVHRQLPPVSILSTISKLFERINSL